MKYNEKTRMTIKRGDEISFDASVDFDLSELHLRKFKKIFIKRDLKDDDAFIVTIKKSDWKRVTRVRP
jgi:hypothetical protein